LCLPANQSARASTPASSTLRRSKAPSHHRQLRRSPPPQSPPRASSSSAGPARKGAPFLAALRYSRLCERAALPLAGWSWWRCFPTAQRRLDAGGGDGFGEERHDGQPGARTPSSARGDNSPSQALPRLLTVREVAEVLRVPREYVTRRLVFERRIPYIKVGRRTLFDAADVQVFLATNRVTAEE
jgi:excisionase family DNA binding protein